MNLDALNKYAPIALGVLRIVVALLFLEHGTQKFFNFPASAHPATGGMPPELVVAGIIETVGSLLLLFGFFGRIAAFIMSGEMAVAFWTAHVPFGHSVFPLQNGGESAVLFCFIFLYIVFAGPGAFSIDGARARRAA